MKKWGENLRIENSSETAQRQKCKNKNKKTLFRSRKIPWFHGNSENVNGLVLKPQKHKFDEK